MSSWLAVERDALATDRLLDAAGVLFAARGVPAVGMAEIAAAAGCSRATLYRYFENRHQLRVAFVHREARRLGHAIADQVAGERDPRRRLVAAVAAAVAGVRSTPTLAAWFADASATTASGLAGSSEVIEALTAAFLGPTGGDDDTELHDRARWVVRIVVSLLTMPGADAAHERHMVERFVAPVVLAP
jgi:AcrR family transcriptional regulator